MALRNRLVLVCVNRRPDQVPKGSCAARGSEDIYARLKVLLREHNLARTEVRALSCSCLDTCWSGPTIAIEPDHYYYGRVTLDDLPEIVESLERGQRVERLMLGTEDFDRG